MKEAKQFRKMARKAAVVAYIDPNPERSSEQDSLAKAFRAQAKVLKKQKSKTKKKK
jgi:hypothetical protein